MPDGGSLTPDWYPGFQMLTSTVPEAGRMGTFCLFQSHHSIGLSYSQGILEEPLLLRLENPKMKFSGGSDVG